MRLFWGTLGINLIHRVLHQWWIWPSPLNEVVFVCFTETMPDWQILPSLGSIRWVIRTTQVSLNNQGEECWRFYDNLLWKLKKWTFCDRWNKLRPFKMYMIFFTNKRSCEWLSRKKTILELVLTLLPLPLLLSPASFLKKYVALLVHDVHIYFQCLQAMLQASRSLWK